MKKILFFIILIFFAGCSSKTVYNQTQGKFFNSDEVLRDLEREHFDTREYQIEKMEEFDIYTRNIYDDLLRNIENVNTYGLGKGRYEMKLFTKIHQKKKAIK